MDIFGSGPHRFVFGPQGQTVVSDFDLGGLSPDTFTVGLRELDISVTGRLVAANDSSLQVLVDAVVAQLIDPPTAGTLIDESGVSWADVSFLRFEPAGPVDRGRSVSLAYEARFRRFNIVP